MIRTYFIEDMSIEEIDDLIERGVCFDLTSKNTILPEDRGKLPRNDVRVTGSKLSDDL